MGHNSVVSDYPKSIRILRVDGLSTGSLDFRTSQYNSPKNASPQKYIFFERIRNIILNL